MYYQKHKIQICKKVILAFLKEYHKGNEKVVSNRDLQRNFGINESMVRKAIQLLRIEGNPICFNESGYYYAECIDDIKDTLMRLHCMQKGLQKVEIGLLISSIKERA